MQLCMKGCHFDGVIVVGEGLDMRAVKGRLANLRIPRSLAVQDRQG
jgi:hypothetical protein